MELSKSLQFLLIDIGPKAMLALIHKKTWVIRLHTAKGVLLGISLPFRLPSPPPPITIISTGILNHAKLIEVSITTAEQIKRLSVLLSDMEKFGSTKEEMMECVGRFNFDEPQENPGNYLILKCGETGADLNYSSLCLSAGNTVTIDSLDIQEIH